VFAPSLRNFAPPVDGARCAAATGGEGTSLTAREAQILRMLEMGLSNQDIAARLCIAVHTKTTCTAC
jgi:DNA-binding CsgD family transcriptional regulator